MRAFLSASMAFASLALAQNTTTAPDTASTVSALAVAEYSALSALAPYASDEYSYLVKALSSVMAALPTGAAVSDLPGVATAASSVIFAGADGLAAYLTSELSLASVPATAIAAVPSQASELIAGLVPIAESFIIQYFPQSMPLTQLPASLLAAESAVLPALTSLVPDLLLAAAPAVTAAHPAVTSLLPEAIEAWLLGIPASGINGTPGTPGTPAAASIATASTTAIASVNATATGVSTATATATAIATAPAVPIASVPSVASSQASGSSDSTLVGDTMSSSVLQQTATTSATVAVQTTNGGGKLVLSGEAIGLVGLVAGLALM